MEWQPIETAPKDGTQILCLRERYTVPNPTVPKMERLREIIAPCKWDKSFGWCSTSPSGNMILEHDNQWRVTHWMPLPEPPHDPTP